MAAPGDRIRGVQRLRQGAGCNRHPASGRLPGAHAMRSARQGHLPQTGARGGGRCGWWSWFFRVCAGKGCGRDEKPPSRVALFWEKRCLRVVDNSTNEPLSLWERGWGEGSNQLKNRNFGSSITLLTPSPTLPRCGLRPAGAGDVSIVNAP